MNDLNYRRILSDRKPAELIGRSTELDRLVDFALNGAADGTLLVCGAPGAGVSEVLKHAYDRLFAMASPVVPIYFSMDLANEGAARSARRFLHQFLIQSIAFTRQDPSILNWLLDLSELAEIASPSDRHWIERLVRGAEEHGAEDNDDALIRLCLGAPRRAAAAGVKTLVMIDDAHAAMYFDGAEAVLEMFRSVGSGDGSRLAVASRRRFDPGIASAGRLEIDRLDFGQTAEVVESSAARLGVEVSDEARDLLANQFVGRPGFVAAIFQSASDRGEPLDRFLNVERAYAHEIFGGRIRRSLDDLFARIAPGPDLQRSVISMLDTRSAQGSKRLSIETWLKQSALGEAQFAKLIDRLNVEEFIRVADGRVDVVQTEIVVADYLAVRYGLEVAGESRAALFGRSVTDYLKRAPRIMASFYRTQASIGLRKLLSGFSLQQIPAAAIDHGLFAEHYKGLPEDEVLTGLRADEPGVQLPQIVFTADAADLYRPIGELADRDRSAIALGFQTGSYSDEDEIVWIAAEIDSKLAASRETAEFWCDRLEMVAHMCGFERFKIWIIAPEGFTPEAMELIRSRDAFGSSRRQIPFIRRFLMADHELAGPETAEEYEIVVPMDDESEMIAANTLEEIARRHNVPSRSINQIKTALLEASINASEHSLSPDRKIRQKFRVEDDRIVITVSNRGLRLADIRSAGATAAGPEEPSDRRGWGLKLIQKLMDEVSIDQTDDGTSISMTKYLRAEEAPA